MSKNKDEFEKDEFEDELGDMEWGDDGLDEINFGEPKAAKPNSKREAVSQSIKDVSSGVYNEIVDNPIEVASDLIDKSMPRSLSGDYYEVKDTYHSVKEEITKASKEIRSAGSSALKAVDNILPENSRLKKISAKLLEKFGEETEQRNYVNKETQQNLEIQNSILEVLGNLTPDAEATAIKEQVTLSRHKSNQELMSTISVSSQKLLDFNYKVTNNFYRKSLELQYKTLFINKEQLELFKTSFGTFTNQYETIIKNTSLPEILKIKNSEQMVESIMSIGRDQISDFIYKELNPFKNFQNSFKTKINDFKTATVDGLSGVREIAENMEMMKDMGSMGISKSSMLGMSLGGGIRSFIGTRIGDAIQKSSKGKEGIYKTKDIINNPSQYFFDKATETDRSNFLGDIKANLLYNIGGMFRGPDPKDLHIFKKDDPNEPAVFNSRTRNSIIKTIPMLLSKIYSSVEGIRTHSDPSNHVLHWDEKTDTFLSKLDMKKGLVNKLKTNLSNNMGHSLIRLNDKFKSHGLNLNEKETNEMLSGLVKYLQENKNTSVSGLFKGNKNLLTYLPDELKQKMIEPLNNLSAKAKDDPYEYDTISDLLKDILRSSPNMFKDVEELYNSGNKSVAEDLGIVKTDNLGNTRLDRNGLFELIQNTIKEHGITGLQTDFNKSEEIKKYYGIKTEETILKEKEKNRKRSKRRGLDVLTGAFEDIKEDISKSTDKLSDTYGGNFTPPTTKNKKKKKGLINNLQELYNTPISDLKSKFVKKKNKIFKHNNIMGGIGSNTNGLIPDAGIQYDFSEHSEKVKLIEKIKFDKDKDVVGSNALKNKFKELLLDPSIGLDLVKMISDFDNVIVYDPNHNPMLSGISGGLHNGNTLLINSLCLDYNVAENLYEIIPHEHTHLMQERSGKLIRFYNVSETEHRINAENYYTGTTKFGNKEYLIADHYQPFKNYFNSPWEKEAYAVGLGVKYDREVKTGRLDPKTDKKQYIKDELGKVKKFNMPIHKALVKEYKKLFEKEKFPWYYNADGAVDPKLMPEGLREKTSNILSNYKRKPRVNIEFNNQTKKLIQDNTNNSLLNKVKDTVSSYGDKIENSRIGNNFNKGKKLFNNFGKSKLGKEFNSIQDKIQNTETFENIKETINNSKEDLNKRNRVLQRYLRIKGVNAKLSDIEKNYEKYEKLAGRKFRKYKKETLEKIDQTETLLNDTWENNKNKSVKDLVENGKSIVNTIFNFAKDKFEDNVSAPVMVSRNTNNPLSTSDYIGKSELKTFKFSTEKNTLKELNYNQENKLREMFFRSKAYAEGKLKDFDEYLSSFGFKRAKDSTENIFSDGLDDLYEQEKEKLKNEVSYRLKKRFKLKTLSDEQEDAMRFTFYNSPEYKNKLIEDFDLWLEDKGFRKKTRISITSILRKTREWDKKIWMKLIGKPIGGAAKKVLNPLNWIKAPFKAGKGMYNAAKLGGKVLNPFAKLGLYGLDGIASMFGLGFMGVNDNKYLSEIKNSFKYSGKSKEEIDAMREEAFKSKPFFKRFFNFTRNNIDDNAKPMVKKGLSGIGKGLGFLSKLKDGVVETGNKIKNSSFDWRILNPFSELKDDEAKFKSDYKRREKQKEEKNKKKSKMPNIITGGNISGLNNEQKVKPLFNDKDGDGLRDGSWEAKLKEKPKKEDPKVQPQPEIKKESDNSFLKFLLPAIGGLVSLGGKLLSGVLGIVPGIKPLLGLIGSGITGLSTISSGIANLTLKGVKFMGVIPKLLGGISTGITSLPGKLISGLGGVITGALSGLKSLATKAVGVVGAGATALMETGAGKKIKELAGEALDKAKSFIASITPESVKAYFGRIKDAIVKKLGKKASGKVLVSLAAKIASRAVPVAGLALLTYDIAMIGKDMLTNGTSFSSAVSKQIIGCDVFNPNEPVLDDEGNPVKPDETIKPEDIDKSKVANETGTEEDTSSSGNKESSSGGFWGSVFNAVNTKIKEAYTKSGSVYQSVKEGVLNTATSAIDWTKKALGGLVGSIPMPNGNGSYAALKDTIAGASKAAGVDEKLMAIIAAIESGFNFNAKAPTGSATGLYQFLKETWDYMVSKYGAKYGIDSSVSRNDPRASALMGAEFLKANMKDLEGVVKRPLTHTDAYMAHFLGSGGAKKFIKAMEQDPTQSAASLFPDQANSNKTIFYDENGRSRSLGELYNRFTDKINKKGSEFNIDIAKTTIPVASPVAETVLKQDTDINSPSINSRVVPNVVSNSTTPAPKLENVPIVNKTSESYTNLAKENIIREVTSDNAEKLKSSTDNKVLSDINSTLYKQLSEQIILNKKMDDLIALTAGNKPIVNKQLDPNEIADAVKKSLPPTPSSGNRWLETYNNTPEQSIIDLKRK